MLQVMEAGIGNRTSTAPNAKILRLPDRVARGAPDGGGLAPEGLGLVRAAYEAAGGSCARLVEMRPLARRLGLGPRAVENLVMRLQAERLVRVVSMANGLLRLTPEGARAAARANESGATSDSSEGAGSEPSGPAAPTGVPRVRGDFTEAARAPSDPFICRDAWRGLGEMLGPLKAGLDRLDLDGVLKEEQRSELAAEIRTIKAQLGSPRPKRRIVAAALESVGGIVRSAAGAAGGAGSETESEGILRAIDAFLGGTGQTGRAARGVGGAAGEAAGEARVGRAARGAPDGAGPARPGGDLADGDGSGSRRPEEESPAIARAREAGGLRVRKRVRDGGWATGQTPDAGGPAVEGADGAVMDAGKGAGSAVDDVSEGGDQAVRGAGGVAGRSGSSDRARAQEAEAGRRVLRVVDEIGDILRTTLNERGEILGEEVVGNVADLPSEDEHADDGGRVAGRARDGSEPSIRPPLDKDGGVPEPRTPPPAGAEETVEGAGQGPRSGPLPQEAGRRTEDRGPGDPPARFLRLTVDGARDFYGYSLGRLGGRPRDGRAQPEGLAGQVPQEDAEARTRASIDSSSAIEESLDRASRGPGAAEAADRREREAKGGAGRQAADKGAEQAIQRAADEVGQGADQAAEGAGVAVGWAVEGASEAAEQAAESAKRMTQDVGGALGQDAQRGSDDEAREADGVVDRTVGQADGAVRRATGLAEEAMKGLQDTGGLAVDQAAGTAEGIAPNPRMPGEHTLGEERQPVRRTVEELGCIIIQSTLDESGDVLDEKIVGRQ